MLAKYAWIIRPVGARVLDDAHLTDATRQNHAYDPGLGLVADEVTVGGHPDW